MQTNTCSTLSYSLIITSFRLHNLQLIKSPTTHSIPIILLHKPKRHNNLSCKSSQLVSILSHKIRCKAFETSHIYHLYLIRQLENQILMIFGLYMMYTGLNHLACTTHQDISLIVLTFILYMQYSLEHKVLFYFTDNLSNVPPSIELTNFVPTCNNYTYM